MATLDGRMVALSWPGPCEISQNLVIYSHKMSTHLCMHKVLHEPVCMCVLFYPSLYHYRGDFCRECYLWRVANTARLFLFHRSARPGAGNCWTTSSCKTKHTVRRFAEEEVDRLAEARTNKNTNIQTKWGVKILTGNLLTSQLSKCVWVSKWMKILNGFKWYMNTYFGWDGDLRNVILKL